MSGEEWMHSLKACAEAQRRIPLELQASLPLPGRKGQGTAECWYYHLACGADGVEIYSPERYALWDLSRMQILALNALKPEPMGDGGDLLTREHRQREDRYLEKFAAWQAGGHAKENAQDIASEWLAAMPQALRGWMQKTLEGENTDAP